mmetsp:Transcript_22785/g.26423  ORF Transcript_22785/g.26423 Transcript_22785/m.26423 type:complete len:216 (-) Transcript_22785:177-824(-)
MEYSIGSIKIPNKLISGKCPNFEPEALQNRVSPQEFNEFWHRLQEKTQCLILIIRTFMVLFLIIVFGYIIYLIMGGYDVGVLILYLFAVLFYVIGMIILGVILRGKLTTFAAEENAKYFGHKGVIVEYHSQGRSSHITLRVQPAAFNYMPPDQYQANIAYNQANTGYNPYLPQNTYPPQVQPSAYGQPDYNQNQQYNQQFTQNQYQGYNQPTNMA